MGTSVDGYCTQRSCRTKIFTFSAADAELFSYGREAGAVFALRYHPDGSDGAFAGTEAAGDSVLDHAEVAVDACDSDPVSRFLFGRQFDDCAARTDLAAGDAFRTTVTFLERHLRLHNMLEVSGRPEHVVLADRYAKLAGSAAVVKVLDALGSGRSQWSVSRGNLLVQYHGISAVYFLLLGAEGCSTDSEGCTGNECPSARMGFGYLLFRRLDRGFFLAEERGEFVMYCIELALLEAVETIDAAASVYAVF